MLGYAIKACPGRPWASFQSFGELGPFAVFCHIGNFIFFLLWAIMSGTIWWGWPEVLQGWHKYRRELFWPCLLGSLNNLVTFWCQRLAKNCSLLQPRILFQFDLFPSCWPLQFFRGQKIQCFCLNSFIKGIVHSILLFTHLRTYSLPCWWEGQVTFLSFLNPKSDWSKALQPMKVCWLWSDRWCLKTVLKFAVKKETQPQHLHLQNFKATLVTDHNFLLLFVYIETCGPNRFFFSARGKPRIVKRLRVNLLQYIFLFWHWNFLQSDGQTVEALFHDWV